VATTAWVFTFIGLGRCRWDTAEAHFLSGLVTLFDKLWSSVASVADILRQPAR